MSSSVFDANVLVHAAVDSHEAAREWTTKAGKSLRLHAPEFIWIEFANALRGLRLAGRLNREQSGAAFELALGLPLKLHGSRTFATRALDVAVATRLSAYDALYLVLADALGATLVTFDRDFVGLYDRVELLE